MLAYPMIVERDGWALIATSPDFPELTIMGEDREEIMDRVVEAIAEAIAARIHEQKDIPEPSIGDTYVTLPSLISVKVMLYQGMREQGVSKVELSRRLGWHLPQVFRVLDPQHGSHLDKMDAALGAIGKKLYVTAAEASNPVAGSSGRDREVVSAM